jgi:membrane-bound lytic murein transglycosylase B
VIIRAGFRLSAWAMWLLRWVRRSPAQRSRRARLTAKLLKTNGWRAGAPFGEGTANFEVMREWNRSVVYRKTMVLFAERLAGP